MSLPQTEAQKKRKKQPDLICWKCKWQYDSLFPHPCKMFKRYQGIGFCTKFEASVGVK